MPVSGRRVCRVLGQYRSTRRKVPRGADDEAALTEDIIALARQYGRYGYRQVTALLREAGWHVNRKRVERIWRREGLKVPQKQPKRSRFGSMTDRASGCDPSIQGTYGPTTSSRVERMMVASSASCRSSVRPVGSALPCRSRGGSEARMCWRHRPRCSSRVARRRISGPTTVLNLLPRPCSNGWQRSA